MKISDIFPLKELNDVGDQVAQILSSWLYNEVNQNKYFDIRAFPAAVRVMAAFAALEREGTAAAFEKELYRRSLKAE
jgi:hypothetical protein